MFNKKAIELSVNFIVILIISIIIFGFGIRFIYNLTNKAKDITDLTFEELDERIGDIVCEGYGRVCIGTERKVVQRKKSDVFGVKIMNVLQSQNFDIEVRVPDGTDDDPFGYKRDKTKIKNPDPSLIVNPASRPSVYIKTNEERTVGIGIQVPPNAASGTYIVNVKIKKNDGTDYVPTQKLYVDVP